MYRNRKYRGHLSNVAETSSSSQRTNSSAISSHTSANVSVHTLSSTTSKNVSAIQTISSEGTALNDLSDKDKENEIEAPPPKLQRFNPSVLAEDEEMFVIPASQITTQSRYISQRSMLSRTQTSQTSSNRLAKNYFEQALLKCAVSLDVAECYVLAMDHISFVSKLRCQLTATVDGRDRKSEFVLGLEEATRDPACLIKLLSGCKVNYRNSDTSKLTQDSLVQDFLMIDCIQDELQLILFDLLKTYAVENDGFSLTLVTLILAHVKLVDQQRHGEIIVEKIFQIIASNPNETAKRLIVTSLEHIIDITMHDQVLGKLFEIFPNDADLFSEETVSTFGNMSINTKTRGELRRRLVNYMTNGADLSMFPTFVHFLLQFSNDDLNLVPQLVSDLRKALCFTNMSNTNRSDLDAIQRAIFDRICTALIRSKKLFDIWLKTIQNSIDSEREPAVDMLVLLVMQSVNDERRNFIESVIRKQIKLFKFTVDHLKDMIENYSTVLHEYSRVLLEMLNNFFKEKEPIVAQFSRSAYSLIYCIDNLDRKLIVAKLVGFVCQVDRESDAKSEEITTNALTVLTYINKSAPSAMQIYGNQLMRILDHTEYLTLAQVRMFMDLLCSVAYPAQPSNQQEELQEHLDMLIRKQVASSFKKVNRQGIIGISRVIDHLIWQEDVIEDDSNRTYDCVDDLPDGDAQKAAKYIELMKSVSRNCPDSLALCYDELAAIVSRRNKRHTTLELNSVFVAWLCDAVTDDFQQYFVAECVPTRAECRGVELDYQLCINTAEETSSVSSEVSLIAIDIGGRVLRKDKGVRAYSSIEVFTSLFNLMRILHFQRNRGNLETINALLGCAIFIPKLGDENLFDVYSDEQASQVLDVLYYTVNWMRVSISAFVTQDEPMIRRKVLTRVSQLIDLQNKVQQYIRNAPFAYTPPGCQLTAKDNKQCEFKKPLDKTQAPKKKASPATQLDSENMTILTALRSQNDTIPASKSGKSKKFSVPFIGQNDMYTSLDPDVMLLLREPIDLQFPCDAANVGLALSLTDFEFIIEDLVTRMEIIFGVQKPSVNHRDVANSIVAADFVSDLAKFVPKIFQDFVQLMDNLKEILTAIEISLKYTDHANHVKYSLRITVRLLAVLFRWNGFKEVDNRQMLIASIACITANADETDLSTLATSVIEVFLTYEPYVIDLPTAVHMFHLIEALSEFVTTPNNHQYAVRLCKTFLSRRWFTLDAAGERGAKCNAALDELLRGMFIRIKVNTMQLMVKTSMDDIKGLHKKDRVLAMFPCITKANFPLLFRKLCAGLVAVVGRRLAAGGPNIAHLKLWEETSAFLNQLLTIIETINIQRNFLLFLKFGHMYVKLFLQHGLPMLDKCFRQNADRVREILRSLQSATRFLHRLCCHSKTIKISAIVAQIPLLRESIETLLVRVKALLVANKCCTTDIWEIGSLKNKDLHGQLLEEVDTDATDGDSVIPDDEPLDDSNLNDVADEETDEQAKMIKNRRMSSRSSSRSRVF